MAKIHTLRIENFRCLENFEHRLGFVDLVCLIGRGDSGKTTILEAISYVLSPNWNLSVSDTDFFALDIEREIVIEVTIYDLPKNLLTEESYGLYQRFINPTSGQLSDEADSGTIPAITVQLKIDKTHEPKWNVINGRQEPKEIRSKDRAKLNMFFISDFVDRHFSWTRGGPLSALYRQLGGADIDSNVIVEIMREAKRQVDEHSFGTLDAVIAKVVSGAQTLGVDISNATTTIDPRDFFVKDTKVALHDERVPFRLKGKGARRLISIAIQQELAKAGGIVLVDELEQGLEPDRAKHLLGSIKSQGGGQIWVTTHSSSVLEEADAHNLFFLRRGQKGLTTFTSEMQGCLRRNPSAFFSSKVVVCEGATEVGFCSAINQFRIQSGQASASMKGAFFADGSGSHQYSYSRGFIESGFKVLYVTDSDLNTKCTSEQKEELRSLGVVVVECKPPNAIEHQVFFDLPWHGVKELIAFAESENGEQSVKDLVVNAIEDSLAEDWQTVDKDNTREALGKAALKGKWFKSFRGGEVIGEICCKYKPELKGTHLESQFDQISDWIDNP